jgi:hypothetical protein
MKSKWLCERLKVIIEQSRHVRSIMDDEYLEESSLDDELDDLTHQGSWADGAVLWSTDWTAETVVSQLKRGSIDLNPNFQRRSAWTDKRQSLFIESLILGLPIPQLILAEDKTKKGSFIVIDGKQRLLAILRFSAGATGADQVESLKSIEPLRLSGLIERADLNGKTLQDIADDAGLVDNLSAYENSSIRTAVIRNWRSDAYLYEVFLRINTGSVQLSPQELRQALIPGPFSNFIDEASANSEQLQSALGLKKPDFRMRDAELLLRFIAYKTRAEQYRGNLKIFLDETSKHFTKQWVAEKQILGNLVQEMEEAFIFTKEVFGEKHYLRKWNGDYYEKRKNRAIFDIMLHNFSDPKIRTAAKAYTAEIEQGFRSLCEQNDRFLSSIESTTKSLEANNDRFNLWAATLEGIIGVDVPRINFGV